MNALSPPPLLLGLVVAATDLSDAARPAFRHAADLAARTSSALHLLYVAALDGHDRPTWPGTDTPEDALLAWAREVAPDAAPDVRPVLEADVSAAEGVLRYLEHTEADLLAVGTHGRRGLRRFILGSTAEELVRLSPCPVLTVPSRAVAAESVRSVLAPVDFSDRSAEAVGWAKRWAALYGASLDLLHVIEEAGPYPYFYFDLERPPLFTLTDLDPNLSERAREELERLFFRAEGPEVEARFHVRFGTPSREIVRFSEEHGSGTIVMGTEGLTGVERLLLGSTSERSVRLAPCPVVTLRPQLVEDPETGEMTPRAELVHPIPVQADS